MSVSSLYRSLGERWLLCLLLVALMLLASGLLPGSQSSLAAESGEAGLEGPALMYDLYLPLTGHDMGSRILLYSTYTADSIGRSKRAFVPDETVFLSAAGSSSFSIPTEARFDFLLSGPCGFNQSFSETLLLPPGDWFMEQDIILPDCPGTYTFQLRITHPTLDSLNTHLLVVNLPSEVIITTLPAFDKCNIPTLSQLQTWMTTSPYRIFNLYMGGISRACGNIGLTPFYVSNASQQGWSFIPTWVGPQSPCSKYRYKFSLDSGLSYWQGRSEADAAYLEAVRLGLGNGTVIYYNMESYPNTDLTCRAAVQSFLNGWTLRLHELGSRSGTYGSSSNMNYWANISHPPDDVWIAYWYAREYDPYASVWNIPNLSNSLWPDNQRIRQYAGDITETWGGLAMTIDSNATRGRVATIPQVIGTSGIAAYGPPEPDTQASLVEAEGGSSAALTASTRFRDMQLLDSGQGWALTAESLLWSSDLGRTWVDRTPSQAASAALVAAHFEAENKGWLFTRSLLSGTLQVLLLSESGWQTVSLPYSADILQQGVSSAYFEFIDENTGWLAIKLQSSSNFSVGELFGTRDGGQTWQKLALPIGERVRFLDARRGWTAGGAAGSELYQTNDGGLSWKPLSLSDPGEAGAGERYYGLPFFEGDSGILPLTIVDPNNPRLELYTTSDGGSGWSLADSWPLETGVLPALPYQVLDTGVQTWLIPPGGIPHVFIYNTQRQQITPLQTPSLPEGLVDIVIIPSGRGWAASSKGVCSGDQSSQLECQITPALWQTEDFGASWSEITPP